MAARRFWVLIAFVLLLPLVLSPARAVDERVVAILPPTDFLVLAIKPENDQKSYKLIPVGEGSVDPTLYKNVVKTLPRGFMGFGLANRELDERAELQQCRTACAANAKCGNFTYVRPGKDRPLGVCHLRRAVDNPNLVSMTPVVETADPKNALPSRDGRRFVLIDSTRNGRSIYPAAQAPSAPVTFKFSKPVASAKAEVRSAAHERVWVNVEALDRRGRVFKRTGIAVPADGSAHQALMRTDSDRIASLRLVARDGGAVVADSIDFVRKAAEAETTQPEDVAPKDDAAPVPEPALVAEAESTSTPAAPEPAEAPASEPVEPAEQSAPKTEAVEVPAIAQNDTSVTFPISPKPVAAPKPMSTEELQPLAKDVPLLAAAGAGAFAFLLGGAGLYRNNYRKRTLLRLSTSLLSDGMDRQTVSVTADEPDLSLRFSVRAPADVDARGTTITITPDGAAI